MLTYFSLLDKYYLVDSDYPNQTGYLAPFKGTTYHIPEFCHRHGHPPQGKYELFNFLHSSLRNVIERAFGVLKQKWRILKAMPSFSLERQKEIIIACFALHNFIRDSQLRDKKFDRCDADKEYMPRASRASNVEEQTQDGGHVEGENEVNMNTIRDLIATSIANARGI
jgi:hypothetical protein